MKNIFTKIKVYIVAHKVISIIAVIVILFVGHLVYAKLTTTTGDTRYVSSKVTTGTIVVSVSGTGQVSDVNQVPIQPKVGGVVTSIAVQNGENVGAGQLILQIDPTDAENSLNNAEASLTSANLSLEKLQIQDSNQNVSAALTKAYSDGLSTVSSTFNDLNSISSGLNTLLSTSTLSDSAARTAGNNAETYRNKAEDNYIALTTALFKNSEDYAKISTSSPGSDIENIITETYATAQLLSDAVKSASDFVSYMANEAKSSSSFTQYQTTLGNDTTTANGDVANLLSAGATIESNKDSTESDNLDIQSAQLSVQQQQNAVEQAKETLADYSVRAPFAGTITNFSVEKADTIGSGTSLGTLVTAQQYAVISLNEVDVSKIQVGQKATLTFDAIPDLSVAGVVSEIDAIGTVSQGVVNYNVKINFDTQDPRIKSGMSVSVAIVTAIAQDVLMVPNGAIKTQGGVSYVQEFNPPLPPPTDGLTGSISKVPPTNVPVQVGLANDTETEITSGLNEGDEIVTRTIAPSATSTATAAPSILGGAGAARGGFGAGGAVRAPAGR